MRYGFAGSAKEARGLLVDSRRRQFLKTTAKAIVSITLLVWLFLTADLGSFISTARGIPPMTTVLAFALVLVSQGFGALRLMLLLRNQGIRIGYFYSLRLTFTGLFAGNFLPGTVGGDIIKVVMLAGRGHRKSVSTACVVVDRLVNMGAMCLLLPSLVTIAPVFNVSARQMLLPTAIAFAAAVILVVVFGPTVIRLLVAHTERHDPLDPGFIARLGRGFNGLLRMLQNWAKAPAQVAGYFAISFALIGASILSAWLIAEALNVGVSFLQLTSVIVIIYFVALIPISLNGLGISEASIVFLLAQLDVAQEPALALALLIRFLFVAASSLGGIAMAYHPGDARLPVRN